ncbi:MAG: TrpB-like pyridoxal phosphate-dependent enzyme [Desulfofustis sp.]|nr:TrpB-like pyridoxal phosphate-dependent enzyme [Desulfofustis sp.]MBT8344674.1 TrpB-like pyridoxal phosphate-dependent enzyme [Desulfofustis sp.]MBT8355448.1 TrpB-like pyridoxal phosphate-dependent enzyme [Desulfofustis sp.]NNK56232.1 TrpB-like pyridoxal phosphate-dependent enzyme [Desulfofustis sp.]RZW27284.1 MAG: TrpB-like pyridoxal phosphate-dependent enzyme [Desulfobulbaceae bacterium]
MNKKIVLRDDQMPLQWYNVVPDLPGGLQPPLDPETKEPMGPEKLAAIFPMGLLEQEMTPERFVDIPEEVLEILKIWRPSPLVRATTLEKALNTKAKIYFKNEGVSPVGSHKPNTAVAQAYYNSREGIKRIATETGAGQWGSALSLATNKFGIECKVYMVRVSFEQKPYRKSVMHAYGANVVASPSDETNTGRAIRAKMPDTPGSLGIAISEAIEDAATREDTNYSLGSVLNHVILHQSIIGLEAKQQMEIAGDFPDVIIGCCGGGSNFAGLAVPFLPDYLEGKKIRFVGTEPASCPTLTAGELTWDFGDTAQTTPLLYMHTLGHDFIPPGIHAGGLRYHGMAPIVSAMVRDKIVEPIRLQQLECFEAGVLFAKTEGIIPAPETCHAIRGAIIEATREPEEPKTILFNFSGHGLIDMASYDKYFAGELEDFDYPAEQIAESMAKLPKL